MQYKIVAMRTVKIVKPQCVQECKACSITAVMEQAINPKKYIHRYIHTYIDAYIHKYMHT